MKKVMFFDDERNVGNSIIVTLNYGWQFSEEPLTHVRGFDTMKEAKKSIKNAVTCYCRECLKKKTN